MDYLDKQMQQWSTRLRDQLRIGPPENNQLATTIAKEVAALPDNAKRRVEETSQIPLKMRIEELVAFQGWMDLVHATHEPSPVVIRAQVAYQNYICFIYLSESCFNVLKKELPSGSTARKCCKFLTDNPVRACVRSEMLLHTAIGAICQISRAWSIGPVEGPIQQNRWRGLRCRSKTYLFGKLWRAAQRMPAF